MCGERNDCFSQFVDGLLRLLSGIGLYLLKDSHHFYWVDKFQQSRKNILRKLALTVAHQSATGVKLGATVKIKRVLVVSKHQNMTISLRLETFLFVK